MNNNIMQLIRAMKNSGNPQKMVMDMLKQNSKGNPMFGNIVNLIDNGNTAAVEEICKNIIRSKGMDPDEVMNQFMGQLK